MVEMILGVTAGIIICTLVAVALMRADLPGLGKQAPVDTGVDEYRVKDKLHLDMLEESLRTGKTVTRSDWSDYGFLPAPRQETVVNHEKDRSLCGKARVRARKEARRAN
jgi:hypothetical protein